MNIPKRLSTPNKTNFQCRLLRHPHIFTRIARSRIGYSFHQLNYITYIYLCNTNRGLRSLFKTNPPLFWYRFTKYTILKAPIKLDITYATWYSMKSGSILMISSDCATRYTVYPNVSETFWNIVARWLDLGAKFLNSSIWKVVGKGRKRRMHCAVSILWIHTPW